MKPLIGIVLRPELSSDLNKTYCGYKEVSDAVIKHGGVPIGIFPPNIDNYIENGISDITPLTQDNINDLKNIVDIVDGVVCQGGDNFYVYDIEVIKYCHNINKPLLGICLGMQTMSCVFNGKMAEVGSDSHKQKGVAYVHDVFLDENSLLKKILGEKVIKTNSRHKTKVISTDLKVVGYSDDNVIEGVEDASKKFFIGVQWHPESMIEYDILMNKLFSYFIQSCNKE